MANALVSEGGSVPLLVVIDDDAELTRRSFGAASGSPSARTLEAYFRHAADLSPLAPYPGRIALIRCEEDDADYRSDRTAGWGEIALAGVTDVVLPGNHNSIVREDDLPVLTRVLLERIDAARVDAPAIVAGADDLRTLRYEARVARAAGDLTGEIARWREAVAIEPDQPSWVYENLAVALFRAHDDALAYEALDEALARDPWPLSIALRFARTWADAGDPRGDLARAVERSRSLPSDHPSVLKQRGMLAAYAGLPHEAEALLREGLRMAPEHHGLLMQLGVHLRRERRFDEAAWIIGELNRINPGLGWIIVLEAQLYLEAGRPATALEVLDRAARFVEQAPDGLLTRGRVLFALGRDDEALTAFTAAAEVAPGSPEPRREAGLVLERLGRHDEARAWAEQGAPIAVA
jgi:tetratricopeptide (TPR) repeat protein